MMASRQTREVEDDKFSRYLSNMSYDLPAGYVVVERLIGLWAKILRGWVSPGGAELGYSV